MLVSTAISLSISALMPWGGGGGGGLPNIEQMLVSGSRLWYVEFSL